QARHNLALLYQGQGRLAEAETQWRAVVTLYPQLAGAWLGLAELALEQDRPDLFDQALSQLQSDARNRSDCQVLLARRHLKRQEFAQAQQLLRPLIALEPTKVWPRLVLSHALLQEGRDWPAAAQALRDVLALEPGNPEATRNLARLRELGHLAEA